MFVSLYRQERTKKSDDDETNENLINKKVF